MRSVFAVTAGSVIVAELAFALAELTVPDVVDTRPRSDRRSAGRAGADVELVRARAVSVRGRRALPERRDLHLRASGARVRQDCSPEPAGIGDRGGVVLDRDVREQEVAFAHGGGDRRRERGRARAVLHAGAARPVRDRVDHVRRRGSSASSRSRASSCALPRSTSRHRVPDGVTSLPWVSKIFAGAEQHVRRRGRSSRRRSRPGRRRADGRAPIRRASRSTSADPDGSRPSSTARGFPSGR